MKKMSKEEEMLSELQEIKKLLTPPPPPPPPKNIFEEFKQFLNKYKVMGLAVAFIMGIYLGSLVQSLVNNMIMPILEIFLPGIQWELFAVGPFGIGAFIGELVTFIIIAFVIFLLVKVSKRFGIE